MPIKMLCDNQATISIAKNLGASWQDEAHQDRSAFGFREDWEEDCSGGLYSTRFQTANILTTPLLYQDLIMKNWIISCLFTTSTTTNQLERACRITGQRLWEILGIIFLKFLVLSNKRIWY